LDDPSKLLFVLEFVPGGDLLSQLTDPFGLKFGNGYSNIKGKLGAANLAKSHRIDSGKPSEEECDEFSEVEGLLQGLVERAKRVLPPKSHEIVLREIEEQFCGAVRGAWKENTRETNMLMEKADQVGKEEKRELRREEMRERGKKREGGERGGKLMKIRKRKKRREEKRGWGFNLCVREELIF
jgi:hypothetical protein